MVVRKCSLIWCGRTANKADQISLHRPPPEEEKQKIWLSFINRPELQRKSPETIVHSVRVCSIHFKPSDFKSFGHTNVLPSFACPSIRQFSNDPPYKATNNIISPYRYHSTFIQSSPRFKPVSISPRSPQVPKLVTRTYSRRKEGQSWVFSDIRDAESKLNKGSPSTEISDTETREINIQSSLALQSQESHRTDLPPNLEMPLQLLHDEPNPPPPKLQPSLSSTDVDVTSLLAQAKKSSKEQKLKEQLNAARKTIHRLKMQIYRAKRKPPMQQAFHCQCCPHRKHAKKL